MMVTRSFLVIAVTIVIAQQAPAAEAASPKFTARQRAYWAFQPVRSPEPPSVSAKTWTYNPIDAFILSKLEKEQIAPAEETDRITLLRRVTFSLIGLPPTGAEAASFLADRSPDAYDKVVDRLLASHRYGERWARHWLDLARYADSDGFKADHTRPNVWRYRDYVIRAFNSDKPYDRFIKEQIAGDELWPDDADARIATGFHRQYPEEYNAQNLRQRRQEILSDITDTTGAVFLGLTFGCAKCHDHKFDPILHDDYYKLQAFFANVAAVDEAPLLSSGELAEYRRKLDLWKQKTQSIRDQMNALLEPDVKRLYNSRFAAYSDEVQAAVKKPAAERTPMENWMVHRTGPFLKLVDEDMSKVLKGEQKDLFAKLKGELDQYKDLHPGELPVAAVMTDLNTAPIETSTLGGGLPEKPLHRVEPGFLTILDQPEPEIHPSGTTLGRRAVLANWIAGANNPLTARVMVNRLWHHHFGKGLVATPSDFGMMGMRPTHPELLDWLASEFVKNGWSVKHMQKLIVTSAAFRQSSGFRKEAAAADSSNKLLWRFPRKRLDAEVIRDSSLYVAGLLNLEEGGPGVFPDLPAGMPAPRGGWGAPDAKERNRRSVYIFVRRNSHYPMLEAFDFAGAQESCSRRNATTTAPQALALLNSRLSREWAESFASRVIQQAGAGADRQVDAAYRLAYSRSPLAAEKDMAFTFLHRQSEILKERIAAGEPVSQAAAENTKVDRVQAAALVDFCQALMNSNEFVYQN